MEPILVFVFLIYLCFYARRFQLSGKAVDALLKLIKSLLPEPNTCLKTKYCFQKYFKKLFPHLHFKRHYYSALDHQQIMIFLATGRKMIISLLCLIQRNCLCKSSQVKLCCITNLPYVYLVLVITCMFVYFVQIQLSGNTSRNLEILRLSLLQTYLVERSTS